MASLYCGDNNNVSKKIKRCYYGDNNNVARKIAKIYAGDKDNIARLVFLAHMHNYSMPIAYEYIDVDYHMVTGQCSCGATAEKSEEHFRARKELKRPTCGDDGYEVWGCKCTTGFDERTVLPATGNHNYTESIVAPTCGDDGYTEHTCSVCGDSYKDNITPATGNHNYVGANGEQLLHCSVCGQPRP